MERRPTQKFKDAVLILTEIQGRCIGMVAARASLTGSLAEMRRKRDTIEARGVRAHLMCAEIQDREQRDAVIELQLAELGAQFEALRKAVHDIPLTSIDLAVARVLGKEPSSLRLEERVYDFDEVNGVATLCDKRWVEIPTSPSTL